jgi:hypothetical protein
MWYNIHIIAENEYIDFGVNQKIKIKDGRNNVD